jgi:hypothetical protein
MGITAINGIAITSSLALTASVATTTAVTDNTTGVGPYYITFVAGSTGNQAQLVDSTGLTWNATTNTLTATTFAGTASQATTSSQAITSSTANSLLVGANTSANITNYPSFTPTYAGGGGTLTSAYSSSTSLIFNPGTTELRAGFINSQAGGSKTSTADANLSIDASLTQSMTWIASFTATRSLIVTNLENGREVNVYIRNTNATQRQIIFSGSVTSPGQAVNMAAGGAGAVSLTTQNIAANTGTMYVNMRTIGATVVGSII